MLITVDYQLVFFRTLLLTLFPPENMCKFGAIAQKVRGGKNFFGGKWFFPPSSLPPVRNTILKINSFRFPHKCE